MWVIELEAHAFLAQDRKAVPADDDHPEQSGLRVLYHGDVGILDVHVIGADLAGLSCRQVRDCFADYVRDGTARGMAYLHSQDCTLIRPPELQTQHEKLVSHVVDLGIESSGG